MMRDVAAAIGFVVLGLIIDIACWRLINPGASLIWLYICGIVNGCVVAREMARR